MDTNKFENVGRDTMRSNRLTTSEINQSRFIVINNNVNNEDNGIGNRKDNSNNKKQIRETINENTGKMKLKQPDTHRHREIYMFVGDSRKQQLEVRDNIETELNIIK